MASSPARARRRPSLKIHADSVEALRSDDVRAKLQTLGLEPLGNSPEEFEKMIAAESRKWSDIVRKAGIKPQQ